MSDLDYFSGNSSFSTSGSNTGGFDLVGAITNAFSPSSSGSSNWSGANLTQAPTLGFGLGGNDGYSGVQVGNGGFSFGAGLFPNTEVIDLGGAKVAGDSITIKGLRDFASVNNPEEVALVVGGLLAAGLLVSSLGGSGPPSGSVEVSAKKPVEPPPAEPPAKPPAEPPPAEPPVVVPPVVPPTDVTPSTDPADPNKEVPKQEPTADEKSLADTLGIPAATLSTLLKYGLPALASYLSYKSAKDAQEQARGVSFSASGPTTATRTTYGGSRYSAAQGGVASLAGGGIASLAGVGETFQMTDYGSDPRNKEVNWAKLQEDRVRMPEKFEGVLQNLNLNNIPSLYSEIPRSQEELENRDYELYAYYGLPDLASNPPNEYLARIIDDIRNALNVGSIPNREQISTIEANQLYDPVGSASASEMPQFNEEPKIYESNNFTSELSGDLNPAFERELRNWEQTGRWGGGGGGFGKGTGLDFEMSMYSNGGMTTKQPFYLGGITDGMADEVPAHIDNQRPAALSDGEFVVPADVVSHLGNGNSNAGAKRLYEMMDRIREARTGNSKQGIQVNPNNFMPG